MAPTKIVLTRPLPADGAALLGEATASGAVELVQWEKDCTADRQWLLTELKRGGVVGILCLLGDRVNRLRCIVSGSLALGGQVGRRGAGRGGCGKTSS